MIPRYQTSYPLPALLPTLRVGDGDPHALERAFAELHGYRECVWFPMARVAIQAYLGALPDQTDRGVVVGSFNCAALGRAIAAAGCELACVDVGEGSFNQDRSEFAAAVSAGGIRAGIYVPLWGIDDPEFRPVGETPLLYDSALQPYVSYADRLRPQDAAVYSQGWGKPSGYFQGGLLCTHNSELADRARAFRTHRLNAAQWPREWATLAALRVAFARPVMPLTIFLNARLTVAKRLRGATTRAGWFPDEAHRWASEDTLRASHRVVEELDAIRADYDARIQAYRAGLADLVREGYVQLPPEGSTLSHFAIRLEDRARRDALHAYLLRCGVFTSDQLFERGLHQLEELPRRNVRALPRTERLTGTTLHLPLFRALKKSEQEKVISAIRIGIRR